MTIPFVPKAYAFIECHRFRLWHAKEERKSDIDLIMDAAAFALDYARDRLRFQHLRKIEICLYHSNEQAIVALNRTVPGNMAMAPYSLDNGSLVIVQNSRADPMNGDSQRMRRILAHEICHLFVREKSGSSTFLGDGLKQMKVRPCLDEGLAEHLSWCCIGKENPILHMDFEYNDDLDMVDRLLNDFDSDRRMAAFYTSVYLVEFLIGKLGLLNFFESMTRLSETVELPAPAIPAIAKMRLG